MHPTNGVEVEMKNDPAIVENNLVADTAADLTPYQIFRGAATKKTVKRSGGFVIWKPTERDEDDGDDDDGESTIAKSSASAAKAGPLSPDAVEIQKNALWILSQQPKNKRKVRWSLQPLSLLSFLNANIANIANNANANEFSDTLKPRVPPVGIWKGPPSTPSQDTGRPDEDAKQNTEGQAFKDEIKEVTKNIADALGSGLRDFSTMGGGGAGRVRVGVQGVLDGGVEQGAEGKNVSRSGVTGAVRLGKGDGGGRRLISRPFLRLERRTVQRRWEGGDNGLPRDES